MALSMAAQEAVWLRQLLADMGHEQASPTCISGDNMGALALARNPVHHARTKHIDIRHHFIRELLEAGVIEVDYLRTEDMEADVLTKGLPVVKFKRLCGLLGLRRQLSGSVVSGSWQRGMSPAVA